MSNEKSDLGLGLIRLNLNDKEKIKETLINVISADLDLSENEEYFQDDTLELGYESEAERIVDEAMKDAELNTLNDLEVLFVNVFDTIGEQDFFGACDYEVEIISDDEVIIAYAYGGYDN